MENTTKNGLWTASYGEIGATLKVLQDNGVTVEHLARLRGEPDYAKRVAEFMLRGGLEGSVHQKLARAIMGKNFFGVEEWSTLYGVNFTKKQLRGVAEFPWGEDILNAPCPFVRSKSIKETHFAFLGLQTINGKPLTILKLQELHPATGQPKFYFNNNPWYGNQKFATDVVCGLRWYLMPLGIVPNSTDKTYQAQVAMLSQDYEVPHAIEEVAKDILYYRKNCSYPNPSRWGRCQDVTSAGGRVHVGDFGSKGLDINSWFDDVRSSSFGLAASRKF